MAFRLACLALVCFSLVLATDELEQLRQQEKAQERDAERHIAELRRAAADSSEDELMKRLGVHHLFPANERAESESASLAELAAQTRVNLKGIGLEALKTIMKDLWTEEASATGPNKRILDIQIKSVLQQMHEMAKTERAGTQLAEFLRFRGVAPKSKKPRATKKAPAAKKPTPKKARGSTSALLQRIEAVTKSSKAAHDAYLKAEALVASLLERVTRERGVRAAKTQKRMDKIARSLMAARSALMDDVSGATSAASCPTVARRGCVRIFTACRLACNSAPCRRTCGKQRTKCVRVRMQTCGGVVEANVAVPVPSCAQKRGKFDPNDPCLNVANTVARGTLPQPTIGGGTYYTAVSTTGASRINGDGSSDHATILPSQRIAQ